MTDLQDKTVWISGGSSMLAKHLIPLLAERGCRVIAPTRQQCDLRLESDIAYSFENCELDGNPVDIVIHLATDSGSGRWNTLHPARTFKNTTLMALNILSICQEFQVEKCLSVISSCAYPFTLISAAEDEMWDGPCSPDISSHGYGKRTLECYSRFLNQEFGLNAVTVVLQNMGGEYDNLDLNKTKVVMALIKKFVDARKQVLPEIELHGSGVAERELLYVGDAAKALLQALEVYEDCTEPLNIGPKTQITIKELAKLIKELSGFEGKIQWLNNGDGQLKKRLDTTKMDLILDIDFTPLREWLEKTVRWYEQTLTETAKP